MTLFSDAIAYLGEALTTAAGRNVTYWRGGRSVALTAVVGRSRLEIEDGEGGSLQLDSRDYLVRAAELVLDGAATLPRPGDQFAETIDGVEHRFEVLRGGRDAWYSAMDAGRTILRIHTRLLERRG